MPRVTVPFPCLHAFARVVWGAAQTTDNMLIIKAETREVTHDAAVGAGLLSVAFNPVGRLAYVANRGAGMIAVVDP